MVILGIETSCDETAAAVVEETGDGSRPGACAPTSWPRRWRFIASGAVSCPNCRRASTSATSAAWSSARSPTRASPRLRCHRRDQGPGLVGSLLVGLSLRQRRSRAPRGVPLVPVHHLAGHIESLVLERRGDAAAGRRAGGVGRAHEPVSRRCAGRLRAARPDPRRRGRGGLRQGGEAPRASDIRAGRSSIGCRSEGNDRAVPFPRTRMTHADRNAPHLPGRSDFSFSGLKTSVLRHVQRRRGAAGLAVDVPLPPQEVARHLRQLPARGRRDAARPPVRGGAGRGRGASASREACRPTAGCARTRLRAAPRAACPCSFRALALSTDNAAMIAAAGLRRFRAGRRGQRRLSTPTAGLRSMETP